MSDERHNQAFYYILMPCWGKSLPARRPSLKLLQLLTCNFPNHLLHKDPVQRSAVYSDTYRFQCSYSKTILNKDISMQGRAQCNRELWLTKLITVNYKLMHTTKVSHTLRTEPVYPVYNPPQVLGVEPTWRVNIIPKTTLEHGSHPAPPARQYAAVRAEVGSQGAGKLTVQSNVWNFVCKGNCHH